MTSITSEEEWQGTMKARVYKEQLTLSLASFENAREWADLVNALQKVSKIMETPIFAELKYVPSTLVLLLCKRIAQCLNPELPAGVHLKTLYICSLVFGRIETDVFVRDLALYSTGLFPLYHRCSSKVKPVLLDIYRKYYLKLGRRLTPAVQGIVLSVLPGVEDDQAEWFSSVLELLMDIRNSTDPELVISSVWRALLLTSECRMAALNFFGALFPMVECNQEGGCQWDSQLFCCPTLAGEALAAALKDNDLLVRRRVLSFLGTHLPVCCSSPQLSSPGLSDMLDYVLQAVMEIFSVNHSSIRRWACRWLAGGGQKKAVSETLRFPQHVVDMLEKVICRMLDVKQATSFSSKPFDILSALRDRHDLLETSDFFASLYIPMLSYIRSASYKDDRSSASVLKVAKTIFAPLPTEPIWRCLRSRLAVFTERIPDDADVDHIHGVQSQLMESILLINFALDFLPPDTPSTSPVQAKLQPCSSDPSVSEHFLGIFRRLLAAVFSFCSEADFEAITVSCAALSKLIARLPVVCPLISELWPQSN